MKYIKVFLYTIFLTVLFFLAENVNAEYQYKYRSPMSSCWKNNKFIGESNNAFYKIPTVSTNKDTNIVSYQIDLCDTPWAYGESTKDDYVDIIGFNFFFDLNMYEPYGHFDTSIQNYFYDNVLSSMQVTLSQVNNSYIYTSLCTVDNSGTSFPTVYCPIRSGWKNDDTSLRSLTIYLPGNFAVGSNIYNYTALTSLSINAYAYYFSLYSYDGNGIIEAVTGLRGNFDGVKTSISDASTKAHNDSVNEQAAMNKNTKAVNDASTKAHNDSVNEQAAMNKNTQAVNDQTNTIKDSNVDVDGSFFSGFDNNTHGLTGIVTAPLQLIGSITSSKCTPLGLPIPFVNQTVELPCMSTIYTKYFGEFFSLYQTITFGMISYWVCVNIMFMVKGFKDPDSDRIEVLDL